MKWGNGCWLKGEGPIEGNGHYVRHIKVRKVTDIDDQAFGALLRQAVRLGGVRAARDA